MPTLHLVRHGETTSNVMKRLDTRLPGAGLTDFGIRQAVRFALERPDAAPVALICSEARRARQTAELMGSVWDLEPQVLTGIHEIQVGDLEDRIDDNAHDLFGDTVRKWHTGDLDAALAGGESLAQLFARYLPVIDDIVAKYLSGDGAGDVYMVSHGAAIRLIAAHLTEVSPEFAITHHLRNTGTVELGLRDSGSAEDGSGARWELLRWGSDTAPFTPEEGDPQADPMG
ncbi:histidine phosphatase family protein [Williamsia sterculiae]|uniref:Probable phosphoglycerate mutase n=1 Tax=Williamsia sterculiae TaxID=1344003 RepID=A0A1N7H942_9NOCA|nr:histidine phosphatase family protein [Williamsia sterculiae]SIS21332.1 probable phosphoglycerate mutase [Williamsia sterculiae]